MVLQGLWRVYQLHRFGAAPTCLRCSPWENRSGQCSACIQGAWGVLLLVGSPRIWICFIWMCFIVVVFPSRLWIVTSCSKRFVSSLFCQPWSAGDALICDTSTAMARIIWRESSIWGGWLSVANTRNWQTSVLRKQQIVLVLPGALSALFVPRLLH